MQAVTKDPSAMTAWKWGKTCLILPAFLLALWLLAALAIAIAYRVAERQFERAELPVSRGKSRC